ncbi:LOW QUALITY PROTEIN: MICAL-like protein 1 [Scylla paramamosain]|uniref:LOW QUALITY PROTEIN: MICAL-like protein 1 n=1 Tax=Scylla paramamosain TaxID=85552 RepID=UPI003083EB4E
MPERRGTQALEAWARRATSGYEGVTITNMSTAWRDGLAFCALIHHFRPDLIEFSSLKSENILENNSLAFRVAEQQLGIPALLDAEDMVANPVPDRLSILTYVSQYYRAFSAMGLLAERKQQARGKDGKGGDVGGDGGESKTTPVSRPQSLPATPKTATTETKTDKVLGRGGRGRREVCVTCQNPVFLAERLMVGAPGQLMHRTCFRCARCSTQLTLAGYYQTERGQYCCETCPDEERLPQVGLLAAPSDSESSSEESESEEEEGESEAPRLPDTPAPTPSPTPPRPRTVFLSQTLVPAPEQPTDLPESTTNEQPSHFSKVSPALFGADKVGRVREHSPDPAPLPRTVKSLRTDPPKVLDTGQTKPHVPPDAHTPPSHPSTPSPDTRTHTQSTPTKTASSIVARRLQMFREMSNKDKQQQQQQVDRKQQHTSPDTSQERRSFPDGGRQDIYHLQRGPLRGSKTEEKEGKTVDIPSITVTTETPEGHGMDFTAATTTTTTSLPSTHPTPTAAQNPFEDDDEEDESANDHQETQGKESSAGDNDRDSDQVVSEAVSHRHESETEKSHREESETEKSHREESESEKSHREESETEKSHREENETEKSQLDKVVGQTQGGEVVSSESHTEVKDAVVSPVAESGSLGGTEEHPVVTPREPHDPASSSQPHYPDDLNPFGSEDEDEDTGAAPQPPQPTLKEPVEGNLKDTKNQTSPAAAAVAEQPPQDSPGRRLIKANLNPFESDEEEEEEKDIPTPKKEEKKSLNPFWSDDEEEEEEEEVRGRKNTTPKGTKVKPPRPPPPTLPRNRSPSTLSTYSTTSTGSLATPTTATTPRKKKVIAPPPPASPNLSLASSPGGSVALRKKGRRAPAPPQLAAQTGRTSPSDQDTRSLDTVSSGDREDPDEVLSWKIQKDLKNHSNKINGTPQAPPKPSRSPHTQFTASEPAGGRHCPVSKSEAGEWKRKKGPAPPRPVPQKRALKKLPMKVIQQELQDIEIKQTELERQGVLLETSIRKRTEASAPSSPQEETPPSSLPPSSPNSIEVEDMILQLFELVNEKNELFRRQTELMYLKREKRLEEEHVELEYQIRCLMLKTPAERTSEDTAQEEELIARLVKVVEQRDEIINCLELDRLREAQEDESIATHMMQYQEKHIDGLENGNSHPEPVKKKKTLKLPKKKKKKEKKDKGATGDADKDVDETEMPADPKKKKKKKKWLF